MVNVNGLDNLLKFDKEGIKCDLSQVKIPIPTVKSPHYMFTSIHGCLVLLSLTLLYTKNISSMICGLSPLAGFLSFLSLSAYHLRSLFLILSSGILTLPKNSYFGEVSGLT